MLGAFRSAMLFLSRSGSRMQPLTFPGGVRSLKNSSSIHYYTSIRCWKGLRVAKWCIVSSGYINTGSYRHHRASAGHKHWKLSPSSGIRWKNRCIVTWLSFDSARRRWKMARIIGQKWHVSLRLQIYEDNESRRLSAAAFSNANRSEIVL